MAHSRAMTGPAPRCTVLVPSYNRLPSVLELLGHLCRQDYPSFEILIIEQSTERDNAEFAELERLSKQDPRIRLELHPPLGVGGARNAGMRSARGEIVLIIDDDDLPASDDWISRHLRNFDDPHCIAVHGGEDREGGGGGGFERRFPRLAQRLAMSYSPFGTPLAFPAVRERKQSSKYLRGANSSIRRDYARKAGGWIDECRNGQEEHDFSFRLRRVMKPGDYIAFDPSARIIRRMDIAGGADRRGKDLEREIEGNVQFYFGVILRNMPLRVALLLPSYPFVIYGRALGWILDDRGHEPASVRLRALGELTMKFPLLFGRSLSKVVRNRAWQPKARIADGS
jgi:glycosyltransferase involved in cell wall biosynthesis